MLQRTWLPSCGRNAKTHAEVTKNNFPLASLPSTEHTTGLNEDIEPQFSRDELGTYINEINDTIIPLSIEFKSRIEEVSGKRIWALVSLHMRLLLQHTLYLDGAGEHRRRRDCPASH